MGSWIALTIKLNEGESAAEVETLLRESLNSELMHTLNISDDILEYILPSKRKRWDVLSGRIPTSKTERQDDAHTAVKCWLKSISGMFQLVYIISANDTSDWAQIEVFKPDADEQLKFIETRSGEINVDRTQDRGDEYFPEHAMMVNSQIDPDDIHSEANMEEDHLRELTAKHGTRPLLHY